MPLKRGPKPKRVLILAILVLGTIMSFSSHPVHAGAYSANLIKNGGFDDSIGNLGLPLHWQNKTDHDCSCQPDPTITVNNTEAILGSAARLDIGQATLSSHGFMGIYQELPNTFFSNLTKGPDELDFWFRLDPKYNGLGDFQIKFLAVNSQELDYVIDPHTCSSSGRRARSPTVSESHPRQFMQAGSEGARPLTLTALPPKA